MMGPISKIKLPTPIPPPGMKEMYSDPRELGVLLEKIYRERGIDFRQYNKSTLERRLSKRLQVRKAKNYAAYAEVLDRDPSEYEKLFDAFTVNQTSFFRNPYVFEVLKKALISLVEKKTRENQGLRIWCAGCSTGQEPYSLAILLAEISRKRKESPQANIIASDIDPKALSQARAGIYSKKEAESIPESLREQYLCSARGKLHCTPELKQLIAFEQHNMTTDPPYADIDLVVCRNVIIYFLMPLQMKVFRNFHQSLRPEGLLLLGDSELAMREARGLFTCLDFEAKFYRKVLSGR